MLCAGKFKLGNPYCLLAFSPPQGSQFTAAQLSVRRLRRILHAYHDQRDDKHLMVCMNDTVCVVSTKVARITLNNSKKSHPVQTFTLTCCTEHLLGSGVRGLALADTANARRFALGASDGSVHVLTWEG